MQVTFTRRSGRGYGVEVVRDFDPPARMQASPGFDESLPSDLAQLLVEREFAVRLCIFGQLAAGGDAGRFWCAPSDRTALLAARAHRLRVTGRGDLGRSERLTAACLASWEVESGRRSAGEPWPLRALHDTAAASPAQLARIVTLFDQAAARWLALEPGESVVAEWPAELTLRRSRLRSA